MSIRHHYSISTDPFERGRDFGVDFAREIGHTVDFYTRVFSEDVGLNDAAVGAAGGQVGEWLSQHAPHLLRELEGLAAGSGQELSKLLAVNARTELTAGGAITTGERRAAMRPGECSVLGVLGQASGGANCLLAQNWDYHPDIAPSLALWTFSSPDGLVVTTLVEAGFLGKIGLNSAGLGCTLNFLSCDRDGGVAGAPVHILLRLVLESTGGLDQALKILRAFPTSGSSCVTVGWCGPSVCEIVGIELSPSGPREVRPERSGTYVHTNHFLEQLGGTDMMLAGPYRDNTLGRLSFLRAALDADEPVSRERLQTLLRSREHDVCAVPDRAAAWAHQYGTLATIVLDLGAGEIWITDGAPTSAAEFDLVVGRSEGAAERDSGWNRG